MRLDEHARPQPSVAIAERCLHLSVARRFVDDGAERGDFAGFRGTAGVDLDI
jgi:hypothetical protein